VKSFFPKCLRGAAAVACIATSSACGPAHPGAPPSADAEPLVDAGPDADAGMVFTSEALGKGCSPPIAWTATAGIPCVLLEFLPQDAGGRCLTPVCPGALGLQAPTAALSEAFCAHLEQQFQGAGGVDAGLADPALQSACESTQLVQSSMPQDFDGGSCASSSEPGWCYVHDAGACPQVLVLAPSSSPPGTSYTLECPRNAL
jgi:hypothetical protein